MRTACLSAAIDQLEDEEKEQLRQNLDHYPHNCSVVRALHLEMLRKAY